MFITYTYITSFPSLTKKNLAMLLRVKKHPQRKLGSKKGQGITLKISSYVYTKQYYNQPLSIFKQHQMQKYCT